MTSTRTRLISAAASAVMAGGALVAAPVAQADGGYYGTWTLTAIRVGAQVQKCDGLPGDEDKCRAGMTLRLKPNYRYSSTIKGAELILLPGKGNFVTTTMAGTGSHVVVFQADTFTTYVRAWEMTLQGTRYGAPSKMVLSGAFGENPDDPNDDARLELIFHRDAK